MSSLFIIQQTIYLLKCKNSVLHLIQSSRQNKMLAVNVSTNHWYVHIYTHHMYYLGIFTKFISRSRHMFMTRRSH